MLVVVTVAITTIAIRTQFAASLPWGITCLPHIMCRNYVMNAINVYDFAGLGNKSQLFTLNLLFETSLWKHSMGIRIFHYKSWKWATECYNTLIKLKIHFIFTIFLHIKKLGVLIKTKQMFENIMFKYSRIWKTISLEF